ncbi:MAG: HD-GYP domain-containing protein [Planctomycetota bacterium]
MSPRIADDDLNILVAEDDGAARELVAAIFDEQSWARPTIVKDGLEAVACLGQRHWDVLITDLNMPRMNGEQLIEIALAEIPDLTVVVVTGNGTIDKAVKLLRSGVYDLLTKPYSLDHFLVSVQKAREKVLSSNEARGFREVVDALLAALESKDRYLNGHASRVCKFAVGLATVLGLGRKQTWTIEFAAKLHDVGKIGIHEDILNKEGKLTDAEFEIMKSHPVLSRDIIAPVRFLQPCLPGVLHHHERIDGRGYPHGLAGDEIPYEARIISVVDSFDAMTSSRSYRPAMPVPKVVEIMTDVSGTQLDAELTKAFLAHLEEIVGAEVQVYT